MFVIKPPTRTPPQQPRQHYSGIAMEQANSRRELRLVYPGGRLGKRIEEIPHTRGHITQSGIIAVHADSDEPARFRLTKRGELRH